MAETVRQLISCFDYVAADYPAAVVDGRVVSADEYEEQSEFLESARELAAALPPKEGLATSQMLGELIAKVEGKAPAKEVAALARELSRALREAYGVVIAPAASPSRERGEALYAENCTPCHGKTGAGDGERRAELIEKYKVPPRSFQDGEVMRDMTPVRVFNALTDGRESAGMPQWSTLTPAERWDLAFIVLQLRHDKASAERGKPIVAQATGPIPRSARPLSSRSDADLDALLSSGGVIDEGARRDAIAYLRRVATYVQSGSPMEPVRTHLATALARYRAGDRSGAMSETTAAYLEGFEPHEASLRRHDESLVIRVENSFIELRDAIDRSDIADAIEQHVLRLGALTETADELLASRGSGQVAFVTALVIVLREGLEAALLVLLILSLARGAGVSRRDTRAVHFGWVGAVLTGVVTWFLAAELLGSLSGAKREVIEGAIGIAAAVVLLAVSHFVLARLDAKRRVAALKQRLSAAVSTSRRRLILASLGFIAVYREAFETVLFLHALRLDSGVTAVSVGGGAAIGALALIGLVTAMATLGKKLPASPLLSALGTLLCIVAVVLIGKGVRSLQEAGVLPISPLGGLHIDWLGVYPTSQTILAQLAIAVAFAGVAIWALVRDSRAAR